MPDINLGKTIGSEIGKTLKSASDKSGLSSAATSIENFTNKNKFTNVINDVFNGNKLLNINGTNIPLVSGEKVKSLAKGYKDAVDKFDKTVNISQYTAPTTLAIKSLDKIGQEIDKTIESSFLLQAFNIKTTDIICALFCFILSTLSCKERNDLYQAMKQVTDATKAVRDGFKEGSKTVGSIGAVAASLDTLKKSADDLFSGNSNNLTTSNAISSAVTIAMAPIAILNSIKALENILKIGMGFKFSFPDITCKSLWDLSRHVLFMVQSQAMQMADEALDKAISPVEEMIKKLVPSLCIGTAAAKIYKLIISTIRTFKTKLLEKIQELLVNDADFHLKMKEFNLQSAFALEIQALLNALNYISLHFFDVAMACGVSPCNQNGAPRLDELSPSDIGDLDSLKDTLFKTSPTLPKVLAAQAPIIADNIEDLAKKISDNAIVTPTDIYGLYDLGNAPKKIIDMINKGAFNNLLDDNYSIYNDNGNIKVSYNTKRNCGED